MNAAAALQLILLVAIAGAGAICGFIASAVILRKKRRARGYFVLGVVTGMMAATITRGRYRRLSAFGVVRRSLRR
jgi:Mn2+/Fe2+ NRAMP family transporter